MRERGANLLVYGIVRVSFQLFFHVYLRMQRIGREHIPASGPVIVAANHRSFLDPFVIATMARRPMYYVAKKELFANPILAWLLSALGAFPVDRGAGDGDTIATATAILARGGIVLIFPEGTRIRPGGLGTPRRGVGRLALETGAPVVPVAVFGTEAVRRGWRIRPRRVRIRAGRALTFPCVREPSPKLAGAVTDRIWPCVMLQWEWLGGMAPARRVAVIGAGAWGTALAVCFARAGLEVDLVCRTPERARHLPGVALPDRVRVLSAAVPGTDRYDIVCLAVPARSLPDALEAHRAEISAAAGLLIAAAGLVAPLGTLPSAFAAERCDARAVAVIGGPAAAVDLLEPGAQVVVASLDRAFARQLAEALAAGGPDVSRTADVTGVELAGCATTAAALAAAAASTAGPDIAGAAAGRVLAEIDALARRRGGRPETFERLAAVVPTSAPAPARDALESVSLLASAARQAHLRTPALDGLAALVEGRIEPEQWAAAVGGAPASDPERAVGAA